MDLGRLRRRDHVLFARLGTPVAQVLEDRRVQQERVLRDDRDLLPQALEPDPPQVVTVE